jgi:OmpA-OmpF porin, OOP family
MSYVTKPTAAIASGSRGPAQAAEGNSFSRYRWPILVLVALLIGLLVWKSRDSAHSTGISTEEQIRSANQRASAALGNLKSGFSAQDLIGALNLEILNFPTAGAQIPVENLSYLDRTAFALKAAPPDAVFEIGGHTDNAGNSESNKQLSQQRADALRNYLISRGVSPTKLVARGYGDTKPVASNDTDEGKFHNRRIEFAVVR